MLYRVPQYCNIQELAWSEIKRTVYLYTRKDKSLGDINNIDQGFFVCGGKDRGKNIDSVY